jgi:hypothetical protein
MDEAGVGRIRWFIVPLGLVLVWLELQATTNADQAVLVVDLAGGRGLAGGSLRGARSRATAAGRVPERLDGRRLASGGVHTGIGGGVSRAAE